MSGSVEDNFFNDLSDTLSRDGKGSMEKCLQLFDKDLDGALSVNEFGGLCRSLFQNAEGKMYALEAVKLAEVFAIFDKNRDGLISKDEFEDCWVHWIKLVCRPKCALLIIDVQNDFISGTLSIIRCPAGQDGAEVVPVINNILETHDFDLIVYTYDWHPENHVSFYENLHLRDLHHTSPIQSSEARPYDTVIFSGPPVMEQKLWPLHCVQNTWGAELHPDLKLLHDSIFIYKGSNPEVDSYSAFWDNHKMSETRLSRILNDKGITDVFVCGIAYDVCVGFTAIHSLEYGYRTILIDDACRGITNDNIEATRRNLLGKHGLVIHSSQVHALMTGRDRNPKLGYFAALQYAKKFHTIEKPD